MTYTGSKKGRNFLCPECGASVRIPWFWVIGIEGIFRCPACKMRFKTGYKIGAILSAVALSLSMVTMQLLVYLFSIYLLLPFVLLLIPLWIFYEFYFRKSYMLWKIRRKIRIARKQQDANSPRSSCS